MKKYLNIDSYPYPYGFHAKLINCIDIAIACSAGHYNHDNYFFYVFYYAMLNNWYDNDNYLVSPKKILRKIGLYPRLEKVETENELIQSIKRNIDNNIPVLIPTTYYSLFYSRWTYLDESNRGVPHLLIIDGYDDDKKVFIIRDTLHVAQSEMPKLEPHEGYQSVGFFKLQLTESMIIDIWNLSNADLKTDMKHKLITILKDNANPAKLNYESLIIDFMTNYINKKNKFVDYIQNFNTYITLSEETIRNHFYKCLNPFFKVFDSALRLMKFDVPVLNEFNKIKNSYLKHRDNTTAVIIKYVIKNKTLKDDKRESIINEILKHDELLMKFLAENFD